MLIGLSDRILIDIKMINKPFINRVFAIGMYILLYLGIFYYEYIRYSFILLRKLGDMLY